MRFIILFFLSVFTFAIELQKAKTYDEQEVKNWVMSEKLDGIRGYWTGKQLLTRKGKKINAPIWFIDNFPNFELDGELWSKREDFENIQSIVMDKEPTSKWDEISYNIFEVPNANGDFLERLKKAENWFEKHPNSYVKIIKQIEVKNKNHLNEFLEEVISKNGEGIIVKDPSKKYHTGRSPHILKVKKAQDMEGTIVGINKGETHLKLERL